MKHRKVLCILAILMALTVMLGAAGCSSEPEESEVYSFKCSNIFPSDSPYTLRWHRIIDEIAVRSEGRVVIEDNPGCVLVPRAESLEALKNGIIDMDFCGSSYCAGYPYLRAGIGSLPFLIKGTEDASALYYDHGLAELLREYLLQEAGIVEIGQVPMAPQIIAMGPGDDIRKWSDMSGKKMRVSVGFGSQLFELAGATAVPGIATGEIYTALQSNLVDGTEITWAAIDTYKLGEVCDSVTEPALFCYLGVNVHVNQQKWNALPEDLQQLVLQTFKDMNKIFVEEEIESQEELKEQIRQQYGLTVNYLSAEEIEKIEAMREPVIASFLEKTGTWGEQALAIVEEYYS